MATYETIRESTRAIGANGYLEVTRKRLVEDGQTNEFLLVTRGFVDGQGEKRWTRFVTLPDDAATRKWLAQALLEV